MPFLCECEQKIWKRIFKALKEPPLLTQKFFDITWKLKKKKKKSFLQYRNNIGKAEYLQLKTQVKKMWGFVFNFVR